MRFEVASIAISKQEWVCDACGGRDHKSCSCNSPAHAEAMAAKKEAHRQAMRAHREKTKEKQRSRDYHAPVDNITEFPTRQFESDEDDTGPDYGPQTTGINPPAARYRGHISRALEAVRLARFDDLTGITIDDDLRTAVQKAADAWSELLNQLEGD